MLHVQDGSVAVMKVGREATIIALFTTWRVNEKKTRCFQHYGRPEQSVDQLHAQICPGHHAPGSNHVSIFNDEFVAIDADIGKSLRQFVNVTPMRGRRTARE